MYNVKTFCLKFLLLCRFIFVQSLELDLSNTFKDYGHCVTIMYPLNFNLKFKSLIEALQDKCLAEFQFSYSALFWHNNKTEIYL